MVRKLPYRPLVMNSVLTGCSILVNFSTYTCGLLSNQDTLVLRIAMVVICYAILIREQTSRKKNIILQKHAENTSTEYVNNEEIFQVNENKKDVST